MDLLFYETNHRKERNDGKDTTDTDFSVPAASAESVVRCKAADRRWIEHKSNLPLTLGFS